jgi:6-phosphogluconolactonase (cycloisomerase 2 family)
MRYHRFSKTSRREFMRGAVALALTGPVLPRVGKNQTSQKMRSVLAYVGAYSSPQGPEGSIGHGQGIYLFEMNPATGALYQRAVFPSDFNPSWLALDPSRTHLYSANEISNYNGTNSGSVSAYLIDPATGHLTLLNTVSSEGASPAHISVHPSGQYVFVANYQGGTVAVLPVRSNGELGVATDVKHDSGTIGSTRATSGPPGSFAISGHDKPHAHMIQADPAGKFVLASDLGLDQIFIWKFDVRTGRLSQTNPASVPLPPGDGPRHFAFYPSGQWFYSLQEEGSTLVTYDYDAASGKLTAKQTISTLPKNFQGTNFTSEVMISADARFLYAANRLHDSIAWFAIGEGGILTFAGEEWTRGDYPRSFNIDPTGNYLYSCNQRADAITSYRINRETGALSFVGQYTAVGTPAIIVFLA